MSTLRKNCLAIFLCQIPALVSAQELNSENTKFGFLIGTNKIVNAESSGPGLTLGADMYHYYTGSLGISSKPALTMSNYKLPDNPVIIESEYLDMPVSFVFRPGKGAVKPHFETGPAYRLDLSEGGQSLFAWEVAVGLEIAGLSRIKREKHPIAIMPELRYSYSSPLQGVYFTLHFLGSGREY